ncbi:MAG TPA: phosphoribosyltransferase family protein [Zeimonas sp.]|jgi:predicted phosphoribosyltransferase|nr:phosphoribosyltransferase family protein [Zeimonas sp.]
MFRDRDDAADRLAQALEPFSGKSPLVLAIPRGAVPMGRRIADALGGDLDVVLVRKIGAPYQPELALGAIDENGEVHWASPEAARRVDPMWLEHEKREQLELLRRRRERYRAGRPPIDPAGRITIVVDDGLATGSTMTAALHSTRARSPSHLICAVPVAAPDSLERVAPYADEVVCLEAPEDFRAVSLHYEHFEQVDDEEVARLLAPQGA